MTTLTTMGGSQSWISGASRATPVVFVVDDDISVRESLELLIEASGWRAETFPVGTGVPGSSPGSGSELPDTRRGPAGLQRSGSSEARRCRSAGHANHLHHRAR